MSLVVPCSLIARKLGGKRFIGFHLLLHAVNTAAQRFHIRKNQLHVDGFHIGNWVNLALHMDDIRILKAAHHMNNGINLANMGKKFIAEPLAL